MQQLAREQSTVELQRYLQDFQNQSGLNILSFYTVDNLVLPGYGRLPECISADKNGFTTLNGRPVLLAQQEVTDNTSGRLLGTATVGIWLEDAFLERLAAATGMQQSILLPDRLRLSSTFADTTTTTSVIPDPPGKSAPHQTLRENGRSYYTTGQITFLSEGAYHLLGGSPNEAIGHHVNEFFSLTGEKQAQF